MPYLVERDGTNCENLPETHAVPEGDPAPCRRALPDRMLLAEANQLPADVRAYFGDGDECHMAFHFPLMPRMFMALRLEDRQPIVEIMQQTPDIPPSCQWALFLRNHDELTLEMVTDEERDYMYLRVRAPTRRMRLNLGIRRRLAPLMGNNRRADRTAATACSSRSRGRPIIYYGDEIGMGDNVYLGDRNGVRTPMQWTGDRNAGFSRADPARLYSPVIMDPVYGYQAINVEAQERDASSLLHWMRNLIGLRKLFTVFGAERCEFLRAGEPQGARVPSPSTETMRSCASPTSRGHVQPVRARPGALRRLHADRDARVHRVPVVSDQALFPDARSLWLLLVRAPAS